MEGSNFIFSSKCTKVERVVKFLLKNEKKDGFSFYLNFIHSRVVSGGSGGSADPPKILEPIERKLDFEHPDPPKSKVRYSDPPM